jgi:hypothetical protein
MRKSSRRLLLSRMKNKNEELLEECLPRLKNERKTSSILAIHKTNYKGKEQRTFRERIEYLGERLPPARSSYPSMSRLFLTFGGWLALLVASPIGSAFFLVWDGVAARKALLLHQEQKENLAKITRRKERCGDQGVAESREGNHSMHLVFGNRIDRFW